MSRLQSLDQNTPDNGGHHLALNIRSTRFSEMFLEQTTYFHLEDESTPKQSSTPSHLSTQMLNQEIPHPFNIQQDNILAYPPEIPIARPTPVDHNKPLPIVPLQNQIADVLSLLAECNSSVQTEVERVISSLNEVRGMVEIVTSRQGLGVKRD